MVARYQEDIGWTEHLPPGWNTIVVQKGDQVPNEGRESLSYLWAFTHTEYNPDDVLLCVQGAPFTHTPGLIHELYFGEWDRYTPLPGWEVTCDGNGEPHHKGLPVGEAYEEWFGRKFPGEVSFTAGAQFAVTGREARRDWGVWMDRCKTEHGPWLMERFWKVIFNG